MSLDDWRFVFLVICTSLILSALSPVAIPVFSKSATSSFLALGVLGSNGMIGDYFPGNISTVEPEEVISWNLYLYNHMGNTKYIAVRAKLLNSTVVAPNSTLHAPSSAPTFFEVRRVLLDNETWLYPFTWYVLKATQVENSIVVKSIAVNDEAFQINATAVSGRDFRIVFELWVYDESLRDFTFSWSSSSEAQSTWNQVWFNVNLGS